MADCGEDLTRWRWARKQFDLWAGVESARADLWLLLSPPRPGLPDASLQVMVNDRLVATLRPGGQDARNWSWHQVQLPAGVLRSEANELQLRATQASMNGWAIALEPGHAQPRSWLSLDEGRSWQQSMGTSLVLRGEYVARLRLPTESMPPRASVTYEDPRHPRVRELLNLLPPDVVDQRDAWSQTLALRTHIATCWSHNSAGSVYTPWDPWTILDWTTHGNRAGQRQIAMCVHYAVLMTAFATALGHSARCVVTTGDVNVLNGHFVCEVWDRASRRWVLHDPNLDLHFAETGRPLSMVDVVDRIGAQQTLHDLACAGSGASEQPSHIDAFVERYVLPGDCYRLAGLWLGNNFISDPNQAPPNHGRACYSETDILWYTPTECARSQLGMFPWHAATREAFLAPNPVEQ